MQQETVQMSRQEVDRLEIIQRIESGQINQLEGALRLKLTTRQMRRLQRAYQKNGATGIISKRRGRPSNNKLNIDIKDNALKLIQTHYSDFKPTFAHEKLTEVHAFKISRESVRQLMMKHGLWKGKRRKKITVHQTRERRSQYGELVQIDGSLHAWFEDRAPKCCLIVYIDDATSKLMQLLFAEVESTDAYFATTEAYIQQYGRPLAYYSDKHTIFRVGLKEAKTGTGDTQFSRALKELGIELICANSPQAKGRVERANSVLQDRLVKELRLRNISDIQTANTYLPEFIADYNNRFSVCSANPVDAHLQNIPSNEALKLILSYQEQRKLSKNLEISYNNMIYKIKMESPGYTMRGASITVIDRLKKVTLIYKGKYLPYEVIDKKNRPTNIKDSKQVEHKPRYKPKPNNNHPWKSYPSCSQKKRQQIQQPSQ